MQIDEFKLYKSHGDGNFQLEDFKIAGNNIIFEKGVLVFHPENISLGNNIYIGHNSILKAYHKNELIIDDNTWIGQNCYFHSAGNIIIGKAVGIGPMVKIITSVHKNDDISIPVLFHELEFKQVIIKDGADIGMGSIILPGVEIGEGAIIGAGSVVNKEVQPYSIVAGVPAMHIRYRYEKK